MSRVLIAAASGIVGALAVEFQTLVLWPLVYVHFPWPGYQYASAHGFVDRYFTESPAALGVSLLVLAVAAVMVLKKSASFRPLAALAFWFTSCVALCGIGFFYSGLRESNLLPLGLLIIAFYAAIPALLGWLTAIVLSRTSSVRATAMR
jgi:hypothetical protein